MPKAGRYPLFLLGLLVIIFGNLGAHYLGMGIVVEEAVSVVGFLFLLVSVAIR
jgi:hypothetical protein